MIYISVISFAFAAIFKAVADTLQHHYDTSVFKNMSYKFWNPNESYKYVKTIPLTKYRPDAWHLANSGMIVCFVLAVVFYEPHLKWFWEVLIVGGAFNSVFGLFYDYILRRK
jgi:hypothetical protein